MANRHREPAALDASRKHLIAPRRRRVRSGRIRPALVVVFAGALFAGCLTPNEFSGAFIEDLDQGPVDDNRDWALRLTVYEFAGDVGGFVEFYEIGAANRRDAPYAVPTSCGYFGEVRRSDDSFVVIVDSPEGDTVQMRVERDGRRRLVATVEAWGGIAEADMAEREIAFVRDTGQPEERQCPVGLVAE